MKDKLKKLKVPDLPTLGIFAFALASTWALGQYFNANAVHPTPLYWLPAALVEIVTAWLTKHAVESFYQVTRSNISKQDKRFFTVVAIAAAALATPTIAASIAANLYEFNGQVLLSLLFPVAVVGCAVGAQIPRSVSRHKSADGAQHRAELSKVRADLRTSRADLAQSRAIVAQSGAKHSAELEHIRAQAAQDVEQAAQRGAMKEPNSAIYARLCAGLNGGAPSTAQDVNKLLNDSGYYSVAGSTARSWSK